MGDCTNCFQPVEPKTRHVPEKDWKCKVYDWLGEYGYLTSRNGSYTVFKKDVQ